MGNMDCTAKEEPKHTRTELMVEQKSRVGMEQMDPLGLPQGDDCIDPETARERGTFTRTRHTQPAKPISRNSIKKSEITQFIDELQQDNKYSNLVLEKKRNQRQSTRTIRNNKKAEAKPKGVGKQNFDKFVESQAEFLLKKQETIMRERELREVEELAQIRALRPSLSHINVNHCRRQPLLECNFKIPTRTESQLDFPSFHKKDNSEAPNLEQLIFHLDSMESHHRPQIYRFTPQFPTTSQPDESARRMQLEEESHQESCQENNTILQLQIGMDEQSQKIIVRETDNISDMATSFLPKQHLPLQLREKIIENIEQRLLLH